MESSLEKFSTAVQTFSAYGIYGVATIFGSLGLINSLGSELFPTVNIVFLIALAIVSVVTRGRLLRMLRTKPLKGLGFLSFMYLAVFVNQWAFVNLEAYLSICLFVGILMVIPYLFRMAVTVARYRRSTAA